jgi:hypothetical protein
LLRLREDETARLDAACDLAGTSRPQFVGALLRALEIDSLVRLVNGRRDADAEERAACDRTR